MWLVSVFEAPPHPWGTLFLAHHRSQVDDVFVASRWLCPGCVEHIVFLIYHRTITFDPANDGIGSVGDYNVVRFLDLWCFLNWEIVSSP